MNPGERLEASGERLEQGINHLPLTPCLVPARTR